VDPGEHIPRTRDDDRGVCRDCSISRVCIRGTRRNEQSADAHPSVPAYLQRARANHYNNYNSHTSFDARTNGHNTRASVPRAR
jgi:hypothetical protein